ncbi:MAG: hypothetical protein JWR69_2811 [Pedosphaera sp.]|nr:hypothetical protein [Pedosphaera sp.]
MDYTLLGSLALVPVFVMAQIYMLVRKMSEPEKMIKALAGLSAEKQALLVQHKNWLAANNFQYQSIFQFGSIQVAVFQQANTQRFCNFNFHQKLSYDMTSHFDDERSLNTGTSNGIGMFPAIPGSYKQGFPNASIEEAWQHHLQAEEYLMRKFGIVWKPLTMPYQQSILEGIRRQMSYVRSIPLWPARTLYWFAVTRKRMANRSVQQQYP